MASAEGARAVGIGWEPAPTPGWVAPHLEAEFPGLSLATVEVDGRPGRSPEPVRRRLRDLSDRLFGAEAIRLRGRPIPWAYRVFFRQIGLDPDRAPHAGRAARPRPPPGRLLPQPRPARSTR